MTKNRYSIWCQIKKKNYKDIGDYQPEIDGYEVLSISEGTQELVMHWLAWWHNYVLDDTPMLSYTADVFGNFKEFVVKRFDETESSQNHFCIYYIAIYNGMSVLILHYFTHVLMHSFVVFMYT